MLNYSDHPRAPLDRVFQALADPTRRAILERLSRAPASVSDLARPLSVSLSALMQHLQVLEDCGVVRSHKAGRVRTCSMEPAALAEAAGWIGARRATMEARLDRLGQYLDDHPEPEPQE